MSYKNHHGFTLIELMVCIIILFVLAGIGVGTCSKIFLQSSYTGTVANIAEMAPAMMIRTSPTSGYSFSIDIKTESGEIVSFSSEDRKFATVNKGDEIKVIVFKYPPWNFEKSGTLYGGRLIKKLKLAER